MIAKSVRYCPKCWNLQRGQVFRGALPFFESKFFQLGDGATVALQLSRLLSSNFMYICMKRERLPEFCHRLQMSHYVGRIEAPFGQIAAATTHEPGTRPKTSKQKGPKINRLHWHGPDLCVCTKSFLLNWVCRSSSR